MLDWKKIDQHWTLFLDRDGVINVEKEGSYILHYGEFVFYEKTREALRVCASVFGRIVIVTNQRGVGKGMMTAAALQDIHDKMVAEVVLNGGREERIFYFRLLGKEQPPSQPPDGEGPEGQQGCSGDELSRPMAIGD